MGSSSRQGPPHPAFAVAIVVVHVITGVLLVIARGHWPLALGFAGLAYVLGVRHAFDADHIVAIDGTTRSLLARGRNARGVGFWFSLGHSTVVLVLALWVAHAARAGARALPLLRSLGGILGVATSAAFMLIVAAINLGIFRDTLAAVRRADEGLAAASPRPFGLATRIFARVLTVVRRPIHMYLVGLLFGLGLDTASEIALLAISATAAAHELPTYAVVVLPLAFASGMSLADTVEGSIIAKAYAWSQGAAIRRARYNLVVTGFTILAALTVSALEFLELGQADTPSVSTTIGIVVVIGLLATWGVAVTIDTLRGQSVNRTPAA